MHVMCDDMAFGVPTVEGDVRSVSMVGVPSLSQVYGTHLHSSSDAMGLSHSSHRPTSDLPLYSEKRGPHVPMPSHWRLPNNAVGRFFFSFPGCCSPIAPSFLFFFALLPALVIVFSGISGVPTPPLPARYSLCLPEGIRRQGTLPNH